ncbi:MAG TPA: hypothetical protein VIL25_01055, partial [Vicinamibacterales bacterium]
MTALCSSACDGGKTACQSAADRIQEVCGAAGFAAYGEDRAGFEAACGTDNADCQSCIDALLAEPAGCANLASCREQCVCPPGTICPMEDGGTDGGGSTMPDAGPMECSPTGGPAGSAPGAACQRGTSCRDQDCNEQISLSALGAVLYSGSMCGDECNPNAANDQCGECGGCAEYTYVGRLRFPNLGPPPAGSMFYSVLDGVCRSLCTPSRDNNGGCRPGYTCDIDTGLCLDAQCRSDAQCKLDVSEDGTDVVMNPASPWTCNTMTGRCTHPGMAGAAAGDPCTQDSDCMEDGQCLTGAGVPDGFCTRIGCNAEGFECGPGETCSLRGLGGPSWCLPQCTVGEEPEEDRFGSDGHGAGCPVGHSCIWDGRSMSPTGGCFPGEYNDVTTPNVGSGCQSDDDCYSPFGYGRCLFSGERNVDSGMCAVANCVGMDPNGILPGVSTGTRVCDESAGELCVLFGGNETYCVRSCENAGDCAPGYACPALLSGGGRLCWPYCFENSDCRAGATCQQVDENGAATGPCDADGPDNIPNTADDPDCFCSDRMPRPEDAGVEADAGVT